MSKTDIDILYHILNHSTYHRAQIARELRELRELGITPPSFNFISFKIENSTIEPRNKLVVYSL